MSMFKNALLSTVAAVFALSTVTVMAQSTLATKEEAGQLAADKAALQRQLKRLDADEASLRADTASGRMSAMSKDAYEVYRNRQAIAGEKKNIAADKEASLQMKSDRSALERQIKRLEVSEARLRADTREGKAAAESTDSQRVYQDQQAVKAERKQISIDQKK